MRTFASAAVPVVCAVESAVENSCCRAAVLGNTAPHPCAHGVWCCIAIQRNTALYILQLYSALHSTALYEYNPPQHQLTPGTAAPLPELTGMMVTARVADCGLSGTVR